MLNNDDGKIVGSLLMCISSEESKKKKETKLNVIDDDVDEDVTSIDFRKHEITRHLSKKT